MFRSIHTVHFVGIGGIGMSGIAEILLDQGFAVTGSDLFVNEAILLAGEAEVLSIEPNHAYAARLAAAADTARSAGAGLWGACEPAR